MFQFSRALTLLITVALSGCAAAPLVSTTPPSRDDSAAAYRRRRGEEAAAPAFVFDCNAYAAEQSRFNKVNKTPVRGLTRRRMAEANAACDSGYIKAAESSKR